MSIGYIRDYYRVPAKRGGRVVCDGKPGVITGTSDPHLLVRLDGDEHTVPVHPTWRMQYLTETQEDNRGQ